MKHYWRLGLVASLTLLGSALSCSGDHPPDPSESVGNASEELSSTQIRVLGFEGVAGSGGDWAGSNVKVQSGTQHVEGAKSAAFAITGSGATLTSRALSSLGPISNQVTLSVWLPQYLKNIPFQGQVGLHLNSPQAGIFSQFYGNAQFAQAPVGAWRQVSFSLPAADVALLSTRTYSDLAVTLDLTFNKNPNFNASNPFADAGFVDALSFGVPASGTGGAGGASGSGGRGGSGGKGGSGGNTGAAGRGGTSGAAGKGGQGGSAGRSGSSAGGNSGAGNAGGGSGASNPCLFAAPPASTPSTPFTFTIKLPHGVPRESIGLATTGGSLTINDSVQVIKDGGGFASVSSVAATSRTSLGASAQVQDAYSEPMGIDLRSSAHVYGVVKTAADLTKQAGVVIDGVASQNVSLQPLDLISWDVPFPTLNRGNCSLEPDNAQTVDPGSYGDIAIKARSHLKLRSGTYFFSSLSVDPQAVLDLDNAAGPLFIYVKNGFAFGGSTVETDRTHMNFLFGVAGATPVAVQSAFRGILVAPRSNLVLPTELTVGHVGAFFALSITAHQSTLIHQQPFSPDQFCAASAACSSFCPCPSGGACSSANQCRTGLSCSNGACACVPSCVGKSCGQDDGCGKSCPATCGNGEHCASNDECQSGSTCTGRSSSSVPKPDICEPAGTHCLNGVKDSDESDVDCGGANCARCTGGHGCNANSDCPADFSCGSNNSACFGQARGHNVCWPTPCGNKALGGTAYDCGSDQSVCGKSCSCDDACDSSDPKTVCPAGEVCKRGLGQVVGATAADVCVAPVCPSNDPALCGTPTSLCGPTCVCTPSCASATCQNPGDGCGGICPGVCHDGETGCTNDAACGAGLSCIAGTNGFNTCRPASCAFKILVPPLCGSPGAKCGEECPQCSPSCDGRQCGLDPRCGQSCGSCGSGTACNIAGQCVAPTTPSVLTVPDGKGGQKPLPELAKPSTSLVGALKGEFSVSEQGTAEFSVPIEVPPGRAGMEPALTLQYSGTRTNGDLGMGWHLDGLSKITRCPRNYALDGTTGPVRNDPTDRFCLDGKRLESVQGAYGANGTQYRTLIDSFAKVVSYVDSGPGIQYAGAKGISVPVARAEQGPDSFRVWTKDGRILTYGRTIDSLVLSPGGVRYAWLVNRVEDHAGNTMQVSYGNLPLGSPVSQTVAPAVVVRPTVVAYTGHTGTPETFGNREVHFDYENRTDPQLRFTQGGAPFIVEQRLSRVTTFVDKVAVKNYKLQYAAGDLSQVEKIFECAGGDDARCKAPTTFQYIKEQGFKWGNLGKNLSAAAQLDINGDGRPDFIATNKLVDGVPAQPTLKAAQVVSDVVVTGAALVADAYLGPEAGFAISATWDLIKEPFWGIFAKSPKITYQNTLQIATGSSEPEQAFTTIDPVQGLRCDGSHPSFMLDYDQDGRDDVLSACGDNDNSIYISRSVGDGSFVGFPNNNPVATVRVGFEEFPREGTLPDLERLAGPILTDVDGDGLQDIVSCRDQYTLEVRRRLPPPQAFETQPIVLATPTVPLPGPDDPPPPARELLTLCAHRAPTYNILDLDGDGTPDLLVHSAQGWRVLRFTKDSGAPALSWQPVAMPDVDASGNGQGLNLGDFNGDGLIDIFNTSKSRYTVWLNTGGSRFYDHILSRPTIPFQNPSEYEFRRTAILDYDADGRDDFLEHWETAGFDAGNGNVVKNRFTWALIPNSKLTSFSMQTADSIRWRDLQGIMHPGGDFTLSGDVNGDGNVDLFGADSAVSFGSGSQNTLLSRVTDGVGKVVAVTYGGYQADDKCTTGSTWPERCLTRLNGVVASYTQGSLDLGGNIANPVVYSYTFVNGRMNVTGHGWLGFDRKIVATNIGTTTTVDYEPVARYAPDGERTTSVVPPYLYPFAGLPKVTTIDQHIDVIQQPLQSGVFERRKQTINIWQVEQSAFQRPFPAISSRTSSTFDRPVQADPNAPPTPFEENGVLLSRCSEDLETDSYGNLNDDVGECNFKGASTLLEGFRTKQSFSPDPESWLISNPDSVRVFNEQGTNATREYAFTYSQGLLATVTRAPNGSTDQRRVSTYVRDSLGNVTQIIESTPTGSTRTTTITYDDDNVFPATITNAAGQTTKLSFERSWGEPRGIVDPNGVASQISYDGFGRVVERRGVDGVSIATYSDILTPNPKTAAGIIVPRFQIAVERRGTAGTRAGGTVTEYDSFGRAVRTISEGFGGAQVIQERLYDKVGLVSASTLPHTIEPNSDPNDFSGIPFDRFVYDSMQRLKRVDHSDGSSKEYQYASVGALDPQYRHWIKDIDCDGNAQRACAAGITLSVDEEGRKDVTISDYAGKVLRNIDGDNISNTAHSSNYFYGAFGQLLETHDNRDTAASFAYDEYGRLRAQVDPASGTSTYTYNAFDELKTSTDAKHQLRTFAHDSLGRLESIIDSAGLSQWIYDQGPNALGRISESISPDGEDIRYGYEPVSSNVNRGLLQSVNYTIDGSPYAIGFDHDDLGRRERVHYPNRGNGPAIVAKYGYDDSGALARVDEVGSGTVRPLWRVNDMFQGHLIQRETFGNGAQASYGYHSNRRWLESIQTTLGTEQIQSLEYTHYQNGLVHGLNALGSSPREYLYDDLNRLSSVITSPEGAAQVSTPYSYDAIGNLTGRGATTTTYRADKPHFIDQVGNNSYHYDPNGNVSSRSGPDVPGGQQVFDYTPFDLPRSVTTGIVDPNDDPDPNTNTVRFEYSANEERLARRDVNGARHFVSDAYQRKLDTVDNTLEERFRLFAGSRQVAEIVRKDGSDKTLYLHTDHLGSPDTISDSDGATFHEHFDPFGSPLDAPNPQLTRVGFTGQDHDDDLGLIDMKGRIYDPLAGRFTTADPVTQAPFWSQGLNRYSYVFNDPINNTDPSGFVARNADVSIAIMGWGAAVTGMAAAGVVGGIAIPGLNLGSSLVGGSYSMFDGSEASSGSVQAPSGAPKSSGINRSAGAGATGENKGGIAFTKLPSACDVGVCLAQSTVAGEGGPGYDMRTDGTGGGVPKVAKTIFDDIIAILGGEVTAAINIIISLEEHRRAYVTEMAAKKAMQQGTDVSPKEKDAVRQENRDSHAGSLTCENCGRADLVDPQRARGGVARPENEAQVDHKIPKAAGGLGKRPNLRVLCPQCNKPGTIPR